MTKIEHIAMKIYRDMLIEADAEGIDLRYGSGDTIEYYNDTKMTMKLYNFLCAELLHNAKPGTEYYKETVEIIDIIADHLTQIDSHF